MKNGRIREEKKEKGKKNRKNKMSERGLKRPIDVSLWQLQPFSFLNLITY
jgi:hypothetical protein